MNFLQSRPHEIFEFDEYSKVFQFRQVSLKHIGRGKPYDLFGQMAVGKKSSFCYFHFDEINEAPNVTQSSQLQLKIHIFVLPCFLSAHIVYLPLRPFSVPVSILSKFGQNPNSLIASTKKACRINGMIVWFANLKPKYFPRKTVNCPMYR